MELIGQYDSPFVRRVAVTMNHHGINFERNVLSVFADFDAMIEVNPVGKVPVLKLDNGEYIFDSGAIIDFLESNIAPQDRLIPTEATQRKDVLRIETVARGLAEKSYERGIEFVRRDADKVDLEWAERLRVQVISILGWLESRKTGDWFCGQCMTLADITAAVAFTFLREKQQIQLKPGDFPNLEAHCDRCEAMPIFAASAYSASEATHSGWKPQNELT